MHEAHIEILALVFNAGMLTGYYPARHNLQESTKVSVEQQAALHYGIARPLMTPLGTTMSACGKREYASIATVTNCIEMQSLTQRYKARH